MSTSTLSPFSADLQEFELRLRPEGPALQTVRLQQAIDAISQRGGGRVVLEAGSYTSGTLVLRDGVDLHLEKGATIFASGRMADYVRREGRLGARLSGGESSTALIFAEKARGIRLTGEGTIDGSGQLFFRRRTDAAPDWVEKRKGTGTWIPGFTAALIGTERPRALVLFADCTDVTIELEHVHNSPAWTIHLLACTSVVIRGVELRGALDGPNIDGIDLDSCRDVVVEDCDILTGDDALALKSTNTWGLLRPSRNITISRCQLRSTTHGFTIGTETQADFENIVVEDCLVAKAGDWRTVTGVGLSIIDGATIKDLRISNMTIEDAVAPIQIRLANAGRGQVTPVPGTLKNIVLEQIRIVRAYGNSLIMGLPEKPLQNITLRDVQVEHAGEVGAELVLVPVPEFATEFPPPEMWRFLPAYGFFCRDVAGLELVNLAMQSTVQDGRPSLALHRVQRFSVSGPSV